MVCRRHGSAQATESVRLTVAACMMLDTSIANVLEPNCTPAPCGGPLAELRTWPCSTTCSMSAMQRLQRSAAAAWSPPRSSAVAPLPLPPAAADAHSSCSVHFLRGGNSHIMEVGSTRKTKGLASQVHRAQ